MSQSSESPGSRPLTATFADLRLPLRMQNVLRRNGCTTVEQLLQLDRQYLLGLPNVGRKTILDTERILARYSLELGTRKLDSDQSAVSSIKSDVLPLLNGISLEDRNDSVLDATLEELGLPQRIINQLPKLGCKLVGQFVAFSHQELLEMRSLGRGSIIDAASTLKSYGLKMGTRVEGWSYDEAVERRKAHAKRIAAADRHKPKPTVPQSVPPEVLLASLEELGLPKRFLNHLPGLGCHLVGQVVQYDEFRLLSMPNLGRNSVSQAKRILESYSLGFGLSVPGWDDETAMERRKRARESIRRTLFAIREGDVGSCTYLEDEISNLLASLEVERNAGMLASLLGFDGKPPKTLDAVGQVHNLTRERVRQIESRARRRFKAKWRPLPRLERALELMEQMEPASAAQLSQALISEGLSRQLIDPQAVIEAANFVDKKSTLRRVSVARAEFICSDGTELQIRNCVRELRRATSSMGCTSVDRLAATLGLPLSQAVRIRDILKVLPETIWLGSGYDWAMSDRPTRNRVVNSASKVFAVTQAITISEMRRCLARSYRLPAVPAATALAALLVNREVASCDGDILYRAKNVPDDVLSSIERAMFAAFQRLPSPCSREDLEDICVDELGVHPTSFWIYLSYSPIVVKLAPGVFALAGAHVAPGSVEDIQRRNRASYAMSDRGWTTDGRLWCTCSLDRIAIHNGTRSIPAYVANLAAGEWVCTVEGDLQAGSIRVENGWVRGLKTALGLVGAENGDFLRLTFDLSKRCAQVRVGGIELSDEPALVETSGDEAELLNDEDAEIAESLDPNDED